MDLSINPEMLFNFAFELRKQDVSDKYSFEFLNGQVEPSILVDIILSNKWNENLKRMETVND